MINQLEKIISQKRREIANLQARLLSQPENTIGKILRGEINYSLQKSFKKSLRQQDLAVIAEIKRKSPSKGYLAAISDPIDLAKNYLAGNANALSILTDEIFFSGNINDLSSVSVALSQEKVPILRKDFIIDEVQIAEAIFAGANAILAITTVLGKNLKDILNSARNLGIEVVVEVHSIAELDLALHYGAEIIGINNRNLKTFAVDTQHALKIRPFIPESIITIAESGINTPQIAQQYRHAGFDAVLIGEALVTSNNPAQFIQECRHE